MSMFKSFGAIVIAAIAFVLWTSVFVVDERGVAKQLTVEVIRNDDDSVVVTGIEPGSQVIDLPPVDMADGAQVLQ